MNTFKKNCMMTTLTSALKFKSPSDDGMVVTCRNEQSLFCSSWETKFI